LRQACIAREGWKLTIPSLALFFVLLSLHFWSLAAPVFLFCAFCLYFFRNPRRETAAGREALISPADGRVTEIKDMVEPEFVGGECKRISIFMSPTDVHVNRAPCEGRIVRMVHRAGDFALAFKKDIDKENERNYILLDREGEKILLVQIAGFLARRIIPYVKENDQVKRGEPVGIIAFGSRVDIYFPKMYESMVQLHEKVKAGLTPLAQKKGSL